MKHRKLLLIVSLALALTMSLGGTLAYLTDMDSETNTFTLGQVDIEIKEENFTDGNPLWPGEKSDKDAYIVNAGKTDAWVWMTVTVPANIKEYVTPVWANGISNVPYTDDADGNRVYTVLVNEVLAAETSTGKILDAMEMSNLVDVQDGKMVVIKNGQPVVIENADLAKLDVTVKAYAVQAKGIDSVDKAYEAYHAQWSTGDGGSSGEEEEPEVVIDSAAKLQEEINKGGTVTLTQDIQVETGTITIPANTEVVLDLNDKMLSATDNANIITNYGKLTIMDGKVYGPTNNYVIINRGDLTIVDTTVENTGETVIRNMGNPSAVTIKGNSVIKNGITSKNGITVTIKIEGGTFSFDPTQYVDAANYTVTNNNNGTYTVTPKQ